MRHPETRAKLSPPRRARVRRRRGQPPPTHAKKMPSEGVRRPTFIHSILSDELRPFESVSLKTDQLRRDTNSHPVLRESSPNRAV